ncbi:S16 family serine protease [Desulfatibacillum aliphaticivorans]|uniref:S16 family serine protease n=1 Tax=Desulfatibacillum aliphaticivorans TaxID=218208 RepID=UPI00041C4FFF|nr:S16 family serine protease [Desulfatibacillum aliphaticivorans]
MDSAYKPEDYVRIEQLLHYPEKLQERLSGIEDTSEISIPKDPIEKVIFQNRAKSSIRKIAQNRGHILMVGRPGTGKSLLANMFQEVLDRSMGEYLRPKCAIAAYPGKDKNHVRFAYENPEKLEQRITSVHHAIEDAGNSMDEFSLAEEIKSVKKIRNGLLLATLATAIGGVFYPAAFIATGITGIGAIFMIMQENNHKAQEKIQRENSDSRRVAVKHLQDQVPEVLYDPRKDKDLMARISEPNARNMKGGFRHDPYQSSNLQTPAHKRAYLGAHAKAPIIYIDELKTMVKVGYMSDLLEIMQNKEYVLEGGRDTGSGAADRSETSLHADNIIIACCNHDTLQYLQDEGDGAFLSRVEDKGEIVQMESAVPESLETTLEVAQYIKQEVENLGKAFMGAWKDVIDSEGYDGVRKRSGVIFGRALPSDYTLKERDFSRNAIMEIVKELRCCASEGKLTALLRPFNGIIKTAELEAILENSPLVEARHVRYAMDEHLSLEGAIAKEVMEHKKALKKYISAITDSIGYVVGLAVISSRSSGRMFGHPLPIHCQVNAGGADVVTAPGKLGDIAKAAAQNVRASIKKVLKTIGAPYVGYEMHVEYIQIHGGVEGDSASVAMDIALISDFIKQPVTQKYGVTGSLTGDIILAVGGVTEKVRSIMDIDLGMEGACVPWQNMQDIEPLLVNAHCRYIQKDDIPGVRIYRTEGENDPFDVYFCKTKYNAYKILMGLDKAEVEDRITQRSRKDLLFIQRMKNPSLDDSQKAKAA